MAHVITLLPAYKSHRTAQDARANLSPEWIAKVQAAGVALAAFLQAEAEKASDGEHLAKDSDVNEGKHAIHMKEGRKEASDQGDQSLKQPTDVEAVEDQHHQGHHSHHSHHRHRHHHHHHHNQHHSTGFRYRRRSSIDMEHGSRDSNSSDPYPRRISQEPSSPIDHRTNSVDEHPSPRDEKHAAEYSDDDEAMNDTAGTESTDMIHSSNAFENQSDGSPSSISVPWQLFDAASVPSITLKAYIERIVTYAAPGVAALTHTQLLCLRLKERGLVLTPRNVHRITACLILLSCKVWEDRYFTNTHYAKVAGIPVEQLNRLEVLTFKALAFSALADQSPPVPTTA